MTQAEFMGLVLDDRVLHTPEGEIALGDVIRAEFARETTSDGHEPDAHEASIPSVAGGAAVGAAVAGAVGAVVGGLLGSKIEEEVPGRPRVRTLSARLVIETAASTVSIDVPREQEVAAASFARKVRRAVRRSHR